MEHCFKTRKTKEGIIIKGLRDKTHYGTSYRYLPDDTVEIIIPHMINGVPVVGIDDCAFKHKFDISAVIVGRHVKRIGKYAFEGCKELHSVKLHNGVELIDDGAFRNCAALEEVKVPESVKEIKHDAFARCHNLKFISVEHVQNVVNTAFNACEELEHIYDTHDIGDFMSAKKPHMFKIGVSTFRSTDEKDGYICLDVGERGISAVPKSINGKPVYYKSMVDR